MGVSTVGYPIKNLYNMAITRSHTMWKSKGTLGATYFRRSRGRTIQCERPASKNGATRAASPAQMTQQVAFACAARYADLHKEDIKVSFNQTRFGSERNYFMKLNMSQLKLALMPIIVGVTSADLLSDGDISAAIELYAAANPQAIVRRKVRGSSLLYLTGSWDSLDNPTGDYTIVAGFSVNGTNFENKDNSPELNSGDTIIFQGVNLDASEISFLDGDGIEHQLSDNAAFSVNSTVRIECTWTGADVEVRALIIDGEVLMLFNQGGGTIDPDA